MGAQKKWYAVYTKPRWEKKVHALFTEKGLESYCPLNKVRKKWSDRIKMVEEPLFKSYVFVQLREEDHQKARMINGVLNFVYWNGRPAIVKEEEINTIRKFLNEYENVHVQPIPVAQNQRIRIDGGLLMNSHGKIQRVKGNRVEVCIESLGHMLVVTLDKRNVQPV